MTNDNPKPAFRLSASDHAPGMPTIVDNATNRSVLASIDGTPVFVDADIASRVLAMLNDTDDWQAECLRWRDEAEAGNYDELIAERDSLRRWKAEATEVMEGLHELGRALGIPLGEKVTGPLAISYAEGLRAKAQSEQHAAQHYREQRDEAIANHAKAVEHGVVVGEAWEKALDRAEAAESALAAVRALHPMLVGCDCDRGCGCPPGGPAPRCIRCRTTWPCQTIAAIEAALATPTTTEET